MDAQIVLLRGICQMPAYVAHETGLFRAAGVSAVLRIAPTAWTVPDELLRGAAQFAVIPWTRVAAARRAGEPLVVIAGSGIEEAAVVARSGVDPAAVRRIALPRRGGMKDLTAMGLIRSLGWHGAEIISLPSGDAAILSLVGQGADAASMVEPYATMLEHLGIGRVLKRTGDLWPGAPGCSLTTTAQMIAEQPAVVQAVVEAFAAGAQYVCAHPRQSAAIAARYIGIHRDFISAALEANRPNVDAVRNVAAMRSVLGLMHELGYLTPDTDGEPAAYLDLTFLERAQARAGDAPRAVASPAAAGPGVTAADRR